jgi:hypothetical protein
MYEFISMQEFCHHIFDRQEMAEKAGTILEALLEARSPRLSDLSHRMPGNPAANYKAIQRFLAQADPMAGLKRLFSVDAPFVLGDPTEIPRPQAENTAYVGWLKDGKTRGFSLLVLATPFRGRAIPFSFISYSSETIQRQATSRNLEHARAFQQVKNLLGDKPLVLDREFSYQGLLEALSAEGVSFVIRLKLGRHPLHLVNEEGRRVDLVLQPGKHKKYRGLYYRGQVEVNVAGEWKKGLSEPLWVVTNLEPEEALSIYQARMKIDESFRDLKSLLCLDKLMNKRQVYMEKMVAMMLIAYSIGLLVGEAIRDHLYPMKEPTRGRRKGRRTSAPARESSKRCLYSGLFILLKQKLQLPIEKLREIVSSVLALFATLVIGSVRTNV